MVTAILFVNHASPTTITKFHDLLMNLTLETLPNWEFELSIFLNNKFSKPFNNNNENGHNEFDNILPNRYLYTLQLSYLNNEENNNRMISIINNNKSILTIIPNINNSINNNDLKLKEHILNGCCNNLNNNKSNENLELLLVNKLQSLWTLKQTIRGEGGIGYLINVELGNNNDNKGEKFKIRTNNCLLHGNFKGFLIEIEHIDELMNETINKNEMILRFTKSIELIKLLIEKFNFPNGNLCFNVLNDSKLDYYSDLCQQYCDALNSI